MLNICRGLEVAQIGVGWSLGWLLVGPAELERGDGHRVSGYLVLLRSLECDETAAWEVACVRGWVVSLVDFAHHVLEVAA